MVSRPQTLGRCFLSQARSRISERFALGPTHTLRRLGIQTPTVLAGIHDESGSICTLPVPYLELYHSRHRMQGKARLPCPDLRGGALRRYSVKERPRVGRSRRNRCFRDLNRETEGKGMGGGRRRVPGVRGLRRTNSYTAKRPTSGRQTRCIGFFASRAMRRWGQDDTTSRVCRAAHEQSSAL